MDLTALWEQLIASLTPIIGPQDVQVWLQPARPVRCDDEVLVVQVQNQYYRDWIVERYQDQVEQALGRLMGRAMRVDYVYGDGVAVGSTPEPLPDMPEPEPEPKPRSTPGPSASSLGINPRQTFDSFVVGKCNEFAHGASIGVAESPADQYNPLFIYGPTGMGKTHLMHAIGNRILHRDPTARVVYVTSEEFMNQMIRGLQYRRMEEFRNRYRKSATVLLVDDIQFLAGKDRTQEEFFHTFNALTSMGRQVVLTSDVEPKNIDKLEDRLRTRFEGGLLADLTAPDYETLMAILHTKAEALELRVPSDLADVICNRVAGSIRELEGVLNRLAALQTFYHDPLTVEFARKRMPEIFAQAPASVTVPGIIEVVARYHSIRSADITGKKRTRTLTEPRHIAMYLARTHTTLSFPELGREFGGRDHSTVQHGFKKIRDKLEENPDLAYKVRLIEQSLNVRPS